MWDRLSGTAENSGGKFAMALEVLNSVIRELILDRLGELYFKSWLF